MVSAQLKDTTMKLRRLLAIFLAVSSISSCFAMMESDATFKEWKATVDGLVNGNIRNHVQAIPQTVTTLMLDEETEDILNPAPVPTPANNSSLCTII